eukprot:gene10598-10755_t
MKHQKKKGVAGMNAKQLLLGDFDYSVLCKPRWPFCRSSPPPTVNAFYGPYQPLGIITSALMGMQHALAMAGGLVTGIPIPKTRYQWGSGILSVMGVSFASVPLATKIITLLMKEGYSFDEAFGKLLGTIALCSVWPVILSFMPHRALKKIFPPIVTGITIFLIGTKLVATGFKYWGGGVFCGENYQHLPVPTADCLIPQKDGSTVTAPCFNALVAPMCSNNGDVKLPFGSAPYIGMGALVFGTIILIELFGSPFMRNASLVLALLVDGKSFLTSEFINSAPVITFLWVKTFPIGFYAPAILPFLIVLSITSVETVGDVAATAEISKLPVEGEEQERRIRGSMLNDGISSLFSAMGGSLPLTTFAQVGWAGALWLLLFGLLGKLGGLILTIPHCVLGGATSFLFASVITSGLKRFIIACALAFGLGVSFVPQWAENNLWPEPEKASSAVLGIRLAVLLILETGFCIGALVAFLLNLIIPIEQPSTPDLPVDTVSMSTKDISMGNNSDVRIVYDSPPDTHRMQN